MSRALFAVVALLLPPDEEPVLYEPPVDAPVADPFRRPDTPYGPGNRGLEYDTRPGELISAAAPGTVTFAGQVGGRLHVTIQHDDGIRTTYGPLARIAPGVARGAALDAGDPVGTAGQLVLWSARLGTTYLDPAVLLAASGTGRVRLVADRPLGPR
jgi:septal ring factor EnvC (AmiA/AmiB activator)